MLVEHMGLQVLDVLCGKFVSVDGFDLVLHDVAVLLYVVLFVEFLAQGHDVLARYVGVRVEL